MKKQPKKLPSKHDALRSLIKPLSKDAQHKILDLAALSHEDGFNQGVIAARGHPDAPLKRILIKPKETASWFGKEKNRM